MIFMGLKVEGVGVKITESRVVICLECELEENWRLQGNVKDVKNISSL